MTNSAINHYQDMYEEVIDEFKELAGIVADSLKNLLQKNNIQGKVEYRVKERTSFLEKISRKNYDDPLNNMPDLAGVRVICNFESDINRVARLIKKEFLIREDVDKMQKLDTDKMGYSGRHIVITLHKDSLKYYPKSLEGRQCEIQIKTVFQHAWSVAEHSLVYKSDAATPVALRRKINQVSVMMEMAQSIFEDVLKEKGRYQERITRESALYNEKSFLRLPVDFETLKLYLDRKYPKLLFSEVLQNKTMKALDVEHYRTLQDVEAVICKASDFINAYKSQAPEYFRYSNDYLSKALGLVDALFREKYSFSLQTKQAFQEYLDSK